MNCKWGKDIPETRNSDAWLCMYPVPLSVIAEVGRTYYKNHLIINKVLCTQERCRCFEKEKKE